MQTFFKDVEEVKRSIRDIREAGDKTLDFQKEMELAVASAESKITQDMAEVTQNTSKKINKTKQKLDLMKAKTEELATTKQLNKTEFRVRENLVKALMSKFATAVQTYKEAQEKYKQQLRSKVKRTVMIVNENATEEEINDVMQREGGLQEYLQEQIGGVVHQEIQQAYNNAVERQIEIERLESSMQELAKMFLDMAMLVDMHGEMLDNIENNVLQTKEFVEDGNNNITDAIVYQKQVRSRQCCIIVVVVVIAAVIIGFLMLQNGSFSGGSAND